MSSFGHLCWSCLCPLSLAQAEWLLNFQTGEVTSILAERAIYQRSFICKIRGPFTSQYWWLGLWSSTECTLAFKTGFSLLGTCKVGNIKMRLDFEKAQGDFSPPLELVIVEDAVRDMSSDHCCVARLNLGCCLALLQRACTCYFLQSTALGLLEPMTSWCKSKKGAMPLIKLWGLICTASGYWNQAEGGTLPAVILLRGFFPST